MSRFIRIRSTKALLDAIERKPFRFFILLNYGAWSVVVIGPSWQSR